MFQYLQKLLKDMSGIKLGEIDIGDQVLDNEYRIKLLFKIIYKMAEKNPDIIVTKAELETMRKQVEKELQDKYPNSGIKVS